jgi:hypothetical protein
MRSALTLLALCLVWAAPDRVRAQSFPLPLNQYAVAPQTSADPAGSIIFNAPKNALLSLTVKNGASAGFALVLDAIGTAGGAQPPCTTTAAARPCVLWCVPMAANTVVERNWPTPLQAQTGLVAMYSTTGCATITTSATAMFIGQAL